MMVNLIVLLGIIAIGAWLGNVLLSAEAIASQARTRVRAAQDSVAKLEAAIKRFHREEEKLNREIDEIAEECATLRLKQAGTQQRLAEAKARQRPQILILSDRRNAGDKEWLVTVVNSQIGEIDAAHPMAAEWARGRDYLVWAETERDAAERTNRRFSARPGYQIKAVVPVKEDLYAPRTTRPAA
jgi:hypothetical protein